MADVHALTDEYEHWLGGQVTLVPAELARKHTEMGADEYRFLRGTYYLWLTRAAAEVPDVFATQTVPLVGDLHVENYGTWRDHDQVRRWGVNDLDELARGPWLLDLLRLAASAVLAPHLSLGDHEVCDTVLAAWYDAKPGPAVDLRDRGAAHLATLVPEFADVATFYADLAKGAPVSGVPPTVVAATEHVAEPGWHPTWHVHEAGTGSLGHRRFVGVGQAADASWHAREAKELAPPSCVWAADQRPGVAGPTTDRTAYDRVNAAIRGPAGATRVDDWQVRDLAPDVVRIQPAQHHAKDAHRLLDAMARAVAGVHAADDAAFNRARSDRVADHHFRDLVATMVDAVRRDFHDWGRRPTA
jgi:hypothetical protein